MPPEFSAAEFKTALSAGGGAAEQQARSFMRRYRPILRGRLYAKGVAQQDLEDLIAGVFEAVLRGLPGLRAPEAFHAWVLTIADNLLKQHWAGLQRRRAVTDDLAGPGPEGDDFDTVLARMAEGPDLSLSDPVFSLCLAGQLSRFRAEQPQRESCIALLVQGYDAREMADLLGRTYGATRQFISQCCTMLLTYLRPCLDDSTEQGLRRGHAVRD